VRVNLNPEKLVPSGFLCCENKSSYHMLQIGNS
jgi:hypothetical protein